MTHQKNIPKFKKYAEARALGLTQKKSKLAAGIPETTPVERIESTPIFKKAEKSLVRAMENEGITDKLIAKRIKHLLNKKQIALSFGKKVVLSNIDPVAAGKALDHIAKVRGDYAPLEVDIINPMDGMPVGDLVRLLKAQQERGNINLDMLPELIQ